MSCESRAPTATGVTESSARADNADARTNADAIPVNRCIRATLPSACHPPPSGPVFSPSVRINASFLALQPSIKPRPAERTHLRHAYRFRNSKNHYTTFLRTDGDLRVAEVRFEKGGLEKT